MSAAPVDVELARVLAEQGDTPIELFPMASLDTDETKVCPCGAVFHRAGRSRIEFQARRYCSIECGRAAKIDAGIRYCAHCGQGFQRRAKEDVDRFRVRRTCRPECTSAMRREAAEHAARIKQCAFCGDGFGRRGSETNVRFDARDCCSVRCEKRRLEPAQTKDCSHCGTTMTRAPRGETPSTWARRQFCDQACYDASRRKAAAARPTTPQRRARLRRPAPPPAPVAPAPPRDLRPPWRPAGFAAEVQVFGTGR